MYLYSIEHLVSSAEKNSIVSEEGDEEKIDDEEDEMKKKMRKRRKRRVKKEMKMMQRIETNDSERSNLKSMLASPEDALNAEELKELKKVIAELSLVQMKRNKTIESSIRNLTKENALMKTSLEVFEGKLRKFRASST